MRYHGISIENIYCYRLPSTVTQSIGNIWSIYDLTRRSKSLLILAQTLFSQGWETTQWNNLVRSWLLDNLKLWLTVGLVQCVTIRTNALTMSNPSWYLRSTILQIRRWCTTSSNGLPRPTNRLWTSHLLAKNPWLRSFVQVLMHPSHVQCKICRQEC